MSKYTTQVRFICESVSGLSESTGLNGVNEVIQKAIPHVFDFEFPIYDEDYRNVLCTKILKHYYTREIGAETVGLWKLWLDARLNEIMPYYNQLYKSAMIEFNPMYDIDLSTKHSKSFDGKTDFTEESSENHSGNSETYSEDKNKNTTRNLFSDTPQGALDNLENETYLTNATKIIGDENNQNSTVNKFKNDIVVNKSDKTVAQNTEDYLQTIKGKTGGASYSKLLLEFRKTFINIDKMIIEELGDLFLNLW